MTEDELNLENVMTPEKFSLEVERRFHETNKEFTYLEIAAELMEEIGVDPEDGKPLVTETLRDKIYAESLNRNLLKEKNTTINLFG
jgi:hypothetical protein